MKKTEIQLIRNATLKIRYAGKTVLVDPMLSATGSFMSFITPEKNSNPTVSLPFSAKKVVDKTDLVLVTHTHPDHWDPATIETLDKEIPLFVQPADKEAISSAGFKNVTPVDDKAEYGEIKIQRTIGKHGPNETLDILGQVSGYVLSAEGYPTLYIIGDCIWDSDIEKQLKTYRPDIIVTNSGGAMLMGQYRILMNAEETVKVAQTIPTATIVATHMEALDHCMTTRAELRNIAKAKNLNILVPENGETVTF
ncbi:hypothetical protein FUAX_18500 [Fulvitalea axinellae]|uniref:MBL fold metallo-hydrolase n=1 Tax=Fulvitalea axinellae TaxID=1182444 RepID=A0AAU9CHA4_9BACT|nr:hypothetical protein FUAX_18500 [Fulvitalea axinellae]